MRRARACLRAGIGITAISCALASACGSRSAVEGCTSAWSGCPCGPDLPCLPGLSCAAGVCVEPGDEGAAGSFTGGTFAGASAGGRRGSAGGTTPTAGAFGVAGSIGVAGAPTAAGGAPSGVAGAPVAVGGQSAAGFAGAVSAGAGGFTAEAPLVLILLDASSSMYDAQVWIPTYEALTGPEGPIARYEGLVRFGFASYRGTTQAAEDDPACAEMTTVPFALSNAASIRETYASVTSNRRRRPYETPTGHALTRVTERLLAEAPGTRKYILLISDGAPDTCFTTNPQCGQDRAVFAAQAAFRAGIQTHAIGIGFGNEYPGCSPDTARCGADHFQDMANAGQGLPVIAPPAGYLTLACTAETGGKLLAEYSDVSGMARFFWTQGPEDVAKAVESVLAQVVGR